MATRLEILKASLEKKKAKFDEKLDNHIATVKQANGQPLNDKRNGQATLNKWERQNDALRNQQKEIEKTERAIEREEGIAAGVEHVRNILPTSIVSLIDSGVLVQWRKHPNTFFVDGVEKARIVWDFKKKVLAHKYLTAITDKEQYAKFRDVFNELRKQVA